MLVFEQTTEGVTKVTRQRKWLWCGAALGLLIGGCKSGELKSYSEPLQVVERAEFGLTQLKEKLDNPDYTPVDEPAIARATDEIRASMPYALSKKLKDKTLKGELTAKMEQLQETFNKEVFDAVYADPRDLATARTGVDQCLAIVAEMKSILGG